jgi:Fuc2NAc and GlcNAc transferase
MLPWLGAFVASCALTHLVRGYALRKSILDVPVARSSHTQPTPRGGGLAIAAVSLGGIALAGLLEIIPAPLAIGVVGGGLLVAWIGWMDDRWELSARSRLLVHLLGALWFLAWTGGFPRFSFGYLQVELGIFGTLFAALLIVWFVNLYNFMDGIDGLAAGEAVMVGTFGAGLLAMVGQPDLAVMALCIAAASAGFLVWNWAPARIFMGDAGSGLLGFFFVAIALAAEAAGSVPLVAWLLLLGVFVYDATVTLLRRMIRGERWREGHRLHAYQRVIRVAGSHARVSFGILLITTVLGVVAAWATFVPEQQFLAAAVGLALVSIGYWGIEAIAPMPRPIRRAQPGGAMLGGRAESTLEPVRPSRQGEGVPPSSRR